MLTKLKSLAIEADGRYASPQELKFADDYFQSLSLRLSAYQKIRDAADLIVSEVEKTIRTNNPEFFISSTGKPISTCHKDLGYLLMHGSAAMLFDDIQLIKEGLLIWHSTITKSLKIIRATQKACDIFPEVVKKYLSPEEAALFSQVFSVYKAVFS